MKTVILSSILILALVLGLGLYKSSQNKDLTDMASKEALVINENDHVTGNPDSDIVMVEYTDLECPACGAYYPLVKQVKEEYKDKAMFVTRHFPLSFHRQARSAAYSLEAASNQGKYLEMLDKIFTTQKDWSGKANAEEIFEQYAEELGLEIDTFKSDRDSDEVRARIELDITSGTSLKVNATPTFILQGKKIQPKSLDEFRSLIEMEL